MVPRKKGEGEEHPLHSTVGPILGLPPPSPPLEKGLNLGYHLPLAKAGLGIANFLNFREVLSKFQVLVAVKVLLFPITFYIVGEYFTRAKEEQEETGEARTRRE